MPRSPKKSATAAGVAQRLCGAHILGLPAPLGTGQLLSGPEEEPVIDTTLSQHNPRSRL